MQSLAPEWAKAAKALDGIVHFGAVDMDAHAALGQPYNVRGFPTIKVFGANKKSPSDYQGAAAAWWNAGGGALVRGCRVHGGRGMRGGGGFGSPALI